MKYYMIPAPRGLRIATEEDILEFYREGRIPTYIKYTEPPAEIPFGMYLYHVNEKGDAKLCVTPQ